MRVDQEVAGVSRPDGEASWSRYWAAGHAHSCPTSFSGFYGPQLQAFWQRQCRALQPADVVVDLGCGNGALLRFLAGQFAEGQSPRLCGVDAASLRLDWLEQVPPAVRERLVVHERTPFRSLPFDAGAVSFAASQFGIEYANADETWAELFRVLGPRAGVAFVLHKQGSHLDAVAADELLLGRAALAEGGIFGAAQAVAPYLARPELRSAPDAGAARQRFNAGCDALVALSQLVKNGDYAHDMLGAIAKILSEAAGSGVAVEPRLQALRGGVEDHLNRVAALRSSALDEAHLQALRTRLTDAGFVLADNATVSEQGFEMGWIIEGRRESGS